MSFFLGRSRKKTPVQPVQRLCGLCFALFVLFQTPLFTMPVEKEGGRVADVPMSAAEVAAIGVLSYNPDYAQATQLALVPGAWWKLACRQLFACLGLTRKACTLELLTDGNKLLASCDYRAMIEPYRAATGKAAGTLAISSGMLVVCALVMPVVPDLYVALVGLGLFVFTLFTTACSPLPTTAFMGLLCVTAVMGPASSASPSRVAAAQAGTRAGGGAGKPFGPSVEGPVTGGGGGGVKATAGTPGKGSPKKRK
ncbi:hypothetical protein HYH02_014910 [Chlamydomonas schloesseri]|uniref:Uncharacterized protein n=1 Tax=Chlamydomonas schloesseri TaxID=2026947 RepID=A0A835SI03_9CHLO|nr:hypothetical protein HYH02_014910 [Chlamydomonas schloesseri]|eukprot:KAG2425911.1 hypothetical protein HYH02_014910 [Chlamydomonas schloesseri]